MCVRIWGLGYTMGIILYIEERDIKAFCEGAGEMVVPSKVIGGATVETTNQGMELHRPRRMRWVRCLE